MEDKKFKVIIVEDVKLELKGTEEIFRHAYSMDWWICALKIIGKSLE